MLWPEINSYKEFDNEKKFLRLENSPPPPPITFVMVRPLLDFVAVLGLVRICLQEPLRVLKLVKKNILP